ncbi:zinc-responsiveness transcriptional activator [Stagonosporopsis vannaccii]|nr:zinc-responsiveness transcriptional activator [Stagonosporopsis vannaccii]
MAPTNGSSDPDLDEGFFDSMFTSLAAPLAGSKRDAAVLSGDDAQAQSQSLSQTTGTGQGEYPAEHVNPQVLCCSHCPEVRPAKRRASSHKVGEFHSLTAESHPPIGTDQQFPDDCFEKFCQECNFDATCPPDCDLVCPGDNACDAVCTPDDACFDPHCAQSPKQCSDGCVDPECTKLSCPDQPCFCQKCDAQPCPLGDPNNDCHFAHSAPTGAGTIYCYDNAPCHFQDQYPGHTGPLAAYETYPCFSQAHTQLQGDTSSTHASTAHTPLLSPSNYTSLESAFTSEASPAPGQSTFVNNCFLNISGDHCHLDNSCCHGQSRACGDHPSASRQNLDLWNSSIAPGNGLSNGFMTFGLNSHPTSPVTTSGMSHGNVFSNHYDNSMMGFNNNTWMLPDSSFENNFSTGMGASKLDFLATAIQQEIMNPLNSLTTTPSMGTASILDTPTNPGTPTREANCVCKWQHAPGLLCLAVFPTASALHKHIKTAHVDNCASCFCQWDGCDASAKDFKQRSKLSRHLLGHAGYRPYACSYAGCDKTFATNQAKDNHERTHTGERPYVCDRCGYTTTTHTQLQTHISALHEGKKPHKCRFCEFTCADSSNLSKHERTHQTLRPYRCPHINCTFKPDCRWENLKRHLRRSGHCPELLVEASDEYKSYRESVRREIDEWHRRNGDEGPGKMSRRKGRGSVGS